MKSFTQYIKEKFVDIAIPDKRDPDTSYAIYKNPTGSESKSVLKDSFFKKFRLILTKDGKGDVYLFDALLLHHIALQHLVHIKEFSTKTADDRLYGIYHYNQNLLLIDTDDHTKVDMLTKNLKANKALKKALPIGVKYKVRAL